MKNFFRAISFILLVYALISGLISLMKNGSNGINGCRDHVEVINRRNDRLHHREWEFNDFSKSFCASYETRETLSLQVGERRNEMIFDLDRYEDFWGTVYENLVTDSKSYIDFMVDSLAAIADVRQLSRSDLAELIVTFVQDIPYSYVLTQGCSSREKKEMPCIDNVALGLLSPYEFLHSLYGDCDTRAVLIYTLLEELGFDPMIVVSNEYAHAMLALHVPSSGDHLTYRGRNYYFWETTSKGWPIGMLPPNTNNVNYWKIALVNEL